MAVSGIFSGVSDVGPAPLQKFVRDFFDTSYDRAKVPPYNGNDPPPAPGSLKALLFPPLLNNVENKGTQGVRARYGAELPPFISIVRYPGCPVMLGMDFCVGQGEVRVYRGAGVSRGVRQTTWERSLKIWKLRILSFEEFSGEGTHWDSSLLVSLTL